MGVIVSSCSSMKSPGYKVSPWCFCSLQDNHTSTVWLWWKLCVMKRLTLCSPSPWGATQPRWDANYAAFGGAAASPGRKKSYYGPLSFPASPLAPESDVRPNDFTYLMPCHRVDSDKHLASHSAPLGPGVSKRQTWVVQLKGHPGSDLGCLQTWRCFQAGDAK